MSCVNRDKCHALNGVSTGFISVVYIEFEIKFIYLMFIEPTIIWDPSGFSGYIWLDTEIVLKNIVFLFQEISQGHPNISVTSSYLQDHVLNSQCAIRHE